MKRFSLKGECVCGTFASKHHACTAIFNYIMTFHNQRSKYSALGYRRPVEFKQHQLRILPAQLLHQHHSMSKSVNNELKKMGIQCPHARNTNVFMVKM